MVRGEEPRLCTQTAGVMSSFCYLLITCTRKKYLATLCLDLFTYKVGIIIVPPLHACCELQKCEAIRAATRPELAPHEYFPSPFQMVCSSFWHFFPLVALPQFHLHVQIHLFFSSFMVAYVNYDRTITYTFLKMSRFQPGDRLLLTRMTYRNLSIAEKFHGAIFQVVLINEQWITLWKLKFCLSSPYMGLKSLSLLLIVYSKV